MNKLLLPDPSRGIAFGWELLEFMFGTSSIKGGIQEILTSFARTWGDNYIVYGCDVVGGNCSAGLIMLNGELLYVDQHTKTGNYFEKVVTNETTWNIRDLDGNAQNILKKNRATLTASSGLLIYTGNNLGNLILLKAGLKFKQIDIGAWDMDTLNLKAVEHGLTEAEVAKIISVDIFINDDEVTTRMPLNRIDVNDGTLDGGIMIITNSGVYGASVVLFRRDGSYFDSNSFNSTAINRGIINIFYTV